MSKRRKYSVRNVRSLGDFSVGTVRVGGVRLLLFNVGFTGRIFIIRHVIIK